MLPAELDSDSDGDEEDDYQVFGRMTIKAQSEAFYQVKVNQGKGGKKVAEEKENGGAAGAMAHLGGGRPLPTFMRRHRPLQPHIE